MNAQHRRIDDPGALKALAHPVRLDLLEAVSLRGPLTATQAAEIVGESPANCSWHLRQLARYGYLEEVPGATGRQRPWQRRQESMEWNETGTDPAMDAAARALTDVYVDHEVGRIRQAMNLPRTGEWIDSTVATQALTWLTREELAEVESTINDLFMTYRDRSRDAAQRPPGARPVRLLALGVVDPRIETTPPKETDHA